MAAHEKTFADLFRSAEKSRGYWAKRAILSFTNDLSRIIDEKGLTRADLARLIGSSPAYVTKVLDHDANFTVATMTKLAYALDSEVRIHMAPKGSRTVWIDEIPAYSGRSLTSPRHFEMPAPSKWGVMGAEVEKPAYQPVAVVQRSDNEALEPAA